MDVTPGEIIKYWHEAGPQRWFEKDDEFDAALRSKFLAAHEAAARGELAAWRENTEGSLALLILLDQFPRNIFRGSAHAFATDPLARATARQALARGFDQAIGKPMRQFFYLPFMHSESLPDLDLALRLYQALGEAEQLEYAVIHRDIIIRFGRFPHRNRVLGRDTTTEEQQFLEGGGFAG